MHPRNNKQPIIPPNVLLIISSISQCPRLKTSCNTSKLAEIKRHNAIVFATAYFFIKLDAKNPTGTNISTFSILSFAKSGLS